jgi:hypothetical protein
MVGHSLGRKEPYRKPSEKRAMTGKDRIWLDRVMIALQRGSRNFKFLGRHVRSAGIYCWLFATETAHRRRDHRPTMAGPVFMEDLTGQS